MEGDHFGLRSHLVGMTSAERIKFWSMCSTITSIIMDIEGYQHDV